MSRSDSLVLSNTLFHRIRKALDKGHSRVTYLIEYLFDCKVEQHNNESMPRTGNTINFAGVICIPFCKDFRPYRDTVNHLFLFLRKVSQQL